MLLLYLLAYQWTPLHVNVSDVFQVNECCAFMGHCYTKLRYLFELFMSLCILQKPY